MKKGIKTMIKVIIGVIIFVFLLLLCFNPSRGSFNHSVLDGGRPNPITNNQQIMNEIQETDRKCYQNPADPRVQRRNYVVYSIFDVRVSDTKTYHILGILGIFRLLNP